MDYKTAEKEIARGRHGQKKVAHNTYLHRVTPSCIAVRLHQTDIILFHANGTATLNSGGWRTVTTKERLNRFSPAGIGQENGLWYVYPRGSRHRFIFEDGINVNVHGKPIGVKADTSRVESAKRKLDQTVSRYIKGYLDHVKKNGLSDPSSGDCWGCFMKVEGEENSPPGEKQFMGVDHLFSHFKEKYYVPSLLWRAVLQARPGDPRFVWAMMKSDAGQGNTDLMGRYLRTYFMKLKPSLLKNM